MSRGRSRPMYVIPSSRPKPPRLTYAVQQTPSGFAVVDADGEVVGRVASEPAARLVLARVRRERAAYELVEDRIAAFTNTLIAQLVAQRLVRTRAEAKGIIAAVL